LGSFLRFAVFFIALVGLLVYVVLPAVAAPLLTQMLRDQGLRGDDLNVSVDYFDPSLLAGRAQRLTVRGNNIELPPALVGRLELILGGVSLLDRSFESIDGQLHDVTLAAGGLTVEVASIELAGPATSASATGRFTPEQAQQLVERAAARAGFELDEVRLIEGGLRLSRAGIETGAAIAVRGGALILSPEVGQPVLLIQPAPSDPWRLSDAVVSTAGVSVSGTVDAAALAGYVSALGIELSPAAGGDGGS
jgi:hypothetical protein